MPVCGRRGEQFLRRFRQHLLPRGFTKIRHYGLLANHASSRLIAQARATLALAPAPPASAPLPDPTPPRCPHCGDTRLHVRGLLRPDGRFIAVRSARVVPAVVISAASRGPP